MAATAGISDNYPAISISRQKTKGTAESQPVNRILVSMTSQSELSIVSDGLLSASQVIYGVALSG